ncbi:MAG: tRNA (adenosine(37)-N6)-threonylcarbamoyltransferase complex ATPase subunit type 1 TsaE [Nitrospirae bacterium]|nr:tRNA (adenosine(37)-N6)-threonylcarbamoyltransferase complex ATPase subunit type 1 TsaE [Nitrospirota bacterium]
MIELISNSHDQTVTIGRRLGKLLKIRIASYRSCGSHPYSRGGGQCVFVIGEFGSGKTTLIKGIAENFGLTQEAITSASFTIIAEYDTDIPFYHIDLYRLDDVEAIYDCGVFECLGGDGVAVVEWADRLEGHFKADIYITITHDETCDDLSQRRLVIEGIDDKDWNNL